MHSHRKISPGFCRTVTFLSAMALVFSSISLTGETWAWFTAQESSRTASIASAVFQMGLSLLQNGQEQPVVQNADGTYTAALTRGSQYLVTLTAGNSTATKGYCQITANETQAYTGNILEAENGYQLVIDLTQDEPQITPPAEEAAPSLVSLSLEEEDASQEETASEEPETISFTFAPHWGAPPVSRASARGRSPIFLENGIIVNEFWENMGVLTPDLIQTLSTYRAYEAVCEHSLPLYFQNDYPNNRYGSGTIASDGCGVLCLAMLADYITGYSYDPVDLARWFGGRAENNIERFELGATTLGLTWSRAENIDIALEALQAGQLLVMMMDGFESENPFTATQHFLILRGITTEGRYLVHDPNRSNYDKWELKEGFERGFTRETLISGYSGAWIFDPQLPEDFVPYFKEEGPRQDNYPGVELTYEEQELIAKVIWAEAQGECAEGQQAVAEVILNRYISDRFGSTIHDVIYGEGQFRSVPKLPDATPWQAQYDALDAALYGQPVLSKDVFYFATEPLTSQVFATIGGHVFCLDELPETTEPEVTEPEVTEPETTEPEVTEPEVTEPEVTEPEVTEPEVTEPEVTEPEVTEPEVTEPETTEPEVTEPEVTEPEVTEPETTEPEVTEPEVTEPVETETPQHDVPHYFQSDYPGTIYGEGTVETHGASIVSLAMVSSYLTGYDYTPDLLAAWFVDSAEEDIPRLEAAATALALPWSKAETLDAAAQAASQGKLLILRLEHRKDAPNPFTGGVHFLVVRGITEDGKYLILDPDKDNLEKEDLAEGFAQGFSLDALRSAYTHGWIFDPDTQETFPHYQSPETAG